MVAIVVVSLSHSDDDALTYALGVDADKLTNLSDFYCKHTAQLVFTKRALFLVRRQLR